MESNAQEVVSRPNEKGDQYPTGPEAIAFALGEVTGKVNNLREDIKGWKDDLGRTIEKRDSTIDDRLEKLEGRIYTIEKWHIKVSTLAGAAGVIGGYAMEWILKHV